MIEYRTLRVALLGAGSVGSQVARFLLEDGDELAKRAGAKLELVGIAVRDPEAPRDTDLPKHLFTTDADALILGADVVIELMGGIEPARTLITQALDRGADVITANKALIAHHGPELFELAERVGAQLLYEAAVAGAIPIIRPLRDSLAGDRVNRVLGIVNGTTNFILDRMHTLGESPEEALRIATELGYAEADPTADVEGFDAQQKAAILASIAFHTTVSVDEVQREGITGITSQHIRDAARSGYTIKLLSVCERAVTESGEAAISARVHPTLVPNDHPLAAVHGGNNAVFIEADAAGDLMFYGAGAGGVETASAVLGDLVTAVRRHVLGGRGLSASMHLQLPMLDSDRVLTRYLISVEVNDQSGVLAELAGIFSARGVSLATLEQSIPVQTALDAPAADAAEQPEAEGSVAPRATLIIGTHLATEGALKAVVEDLRQSAAVRAVTGVLRIERGA